MSVNSRPVRRRRLAVTSISILSLIASALVAGGIALARPANAMSRAGGAYAVAPGSTSAMAGRGSVKPTIVFVHGAFADASGFSVEIAALQRRGYDVLAPADPLRGLTSDSDYIRSVLQTITGPIVLVGHSYGGAVITNAARGVPNVEALVYLAAFIPDEGQNINNSYDPTTYPGSLLGPDTTIVRPAPNAAAKDGQDLDIYINPADFAEVFAGDVRASQAAVLAAEQRPLSLTANNEASGPPAWKTIPSWDLVTLDDHAISPGGQLFMARRAGAHIERVHSAHDVMISHPQAVLDTVLEAVRAVH